MIDWQDYWYVGRYRNKEGNLWWGIFWKHNGDLVVAGEDYNEDSVKQVAKGLFQVVADGPKTFGLGLEYLNVVFEEKVLT